MKRTLLTAMLFALASTALAVTPSTELFLPSVGHGQGSCQGSVCSQWRSDAWVYNPDTAKTAIVNIYFLRRGATNPAPAQVGPITIAPGETKEYIDIITSTFNSDGYGALRFVADNPIIVTGRIYDENVVTNRGTGTAGQFFAGIPSQAAIGAGQSTDIIGLAQDAADIWRSNYGFVETTGNPVDLVVELLSSTGTVLSSWQPDGAFVLGAFGSQQFSVTKLPAAPRGLNQRLRIRAISGTGKLIAYASRVDNRTGDPSTVEMTMIATPTGGVIIPKTGQFDGVVLGQDGAAPNGAVRLAVGETAITSFAVLAGVPCPADAGGVLVDFSGTNLAFDASGHFSATLAPQAYAAVDGTTAFSTVWTFSGTHQTDGSFSGALTSVTTGGSNKTEFNYALCNGTVSNRTWYASFSPSNK